MMASVFDNNVSVDASGNVTVAGDLTVNGVTTTISTTNTVVTDKLIELGNGVSGTPSGDAGIIVERGSSTNAALIWDESADAWVVCTTSATGASTGDLTLTGATLSAGKLSLPEAASLDISTPLLPTTDHTATGLTAQMLAGGAIGAFETVCIHTTTGEVVISDADAIATMPVIGIAPAAISDPGSGTILLQGFIRDDTWNWTLGGILYASTTAGAMTHTAPSGTGDLVQAVGIALSADVVYFNPSLTLVEVA